MNYLNLARDLYWSQHLKDGRLIERHKNLFLCSSIHLSAKIGLGENTDIDSKGNYTTVKSFSLPDLWGHWKDFWMNQRQIYEVFNITDEVRNAEFVIYNVFWNKGKWIMWTFQCDLDEVRYKKAGKYAARCNALLTFLSWMKLSRKARKKLWNIRIITSIYSLLSNVNVSKKCNKRHEVYGKTWRAKTSPCCPCPRKMKREFVRLLSWRLQILSVSAESIKFAEV